MSEIRLNLVTALKAIQEWEESLILHVDSKSEDGKTNTTEVSFANEEDYDRALAILQSRLRWRRKTGRVGLGQAISTPVTLALTLSVVMLFYWGMSYVIEGMPCPVGRGSSLWWLFLHLPINIVGIKWTSIILGSGVAFFVSQVVKRAIVHPLQHILLPPGKVEMQGVQIKQHAIEDRPHD